MDTKTVVKKFAVYGRNIQPSAVEILLKNINSHDLDGVIAHICKTVNSFIISPEDVLSALNNFKKREDNGKKNKKVQKSVNVVGNVTIRDVTGKSSCEGSVEDFIAYFNSRFEKLSSLLRKRLKPIKLTSVSKFQNETVDVVGMVKDVIVDEKAVIVYLNITSQNEAKKQEVVKNLKQVLSEYFVKVSIEISGDAPSQAPPIEPQQQTHPAILDNVKHVTAIASGKGGVGKSTVAANLACAMAIQGKKVGLLDLDIYGPSLPIVLGLNEQPELTQDKKLIPLEKFGMKVMSFGFISGNETPVIWRGPLVARMTEQFFRDVKWGELDVMILDLPPGTGDIQLTLTQNFECQVQSW